MPRRAGERTERKTSVYEDIPSWVQYGGSERRYNAIDMGPAMLDIEQGKKVIHFDGPGGRRGPGGCRGPGGRMYRVVPEVVEVPEVSLRCELFILITYIK